MVLRWGRTLDGSGLGADNLFACPDGLWFDADSRLWIQTDIGEEVINKGPLAPFGNNAMLCRMGRSRALSRRISSAALALVRSCDNIPRLRN